MRKPSLRRRLFLAASFVPCVLLLGLYLAFFLGHAAALAAFPYDWDQGEGYDAWSAWLLDRGQLPYSHNDVFPYYSSNYPPLWSYLASLPMAWFGPGLGPPRLLSTLAALLAAVVIGLAARRRASSNLAGLLATGFFLGSPYVYNSTPLARVNGLTLLFACLAVSLFETPTNRRLALGTLALLAALFTKQTAFDAAAACLLYALLLRPRAASMAAAATGVFGAAGLLLLLAATRGAFWTNTVAGNANPFDVGQLLLYLWNFFEIHGFLLALAVAEAALVLRRPRLLSPWVLYFGASALVALGVGKWGAGESYFLPLIASTCVLAAAFVARLVRRLASGVRQAGLLGSRPVEAAAALAMGAALFGQGLLMAHGPLVTDEPWLQNRGVQAAMLGTSPGGADRAAGDQVVEIMLRSEGPVLSEAPSFAVAAGRPVVANATHLRNLHDAGLWDPSALVAELEQRRYDVVVLNANLYPEPVLAAIGRSYYLARTVTMNGATYQIFLPGSV